MPIVTSLWRLWIWVTTSPENFLANVFLYLPNAMQNLVQEWYPGLVIDAAEVYQDLPKGKWIRLLSLEPGEAGDGISCTLEAVNLGDNLSYEAISYCWGELSDRVVIQCNGRQVTVTRNLSDALQQVRDAKKPRTVWIDGICINQSSLAERGHQVNLMKQIFVKAKAVSVCVGRCDDGETKGVLRHIKSVLDYFHPYTGSWDRLREAPHPEPNHEMCDPKAWAHTLDFFMRPWFSRVWVLQEVGLSSSSVLFCGSETLPWVDILRFRLTITNRWDVPCIMHGFFLSENLVVGRMIDAFAGLWCTYGTDVSRENADLWGQYFPPDRHIQVSAITFLDVLIVASRFEATDPRDFVYAFLGHPSARLKISGPHGPTIVEPDYTISTNELFQNIAIRLIQELGDLLLLSTVRHTAETWTDMSLPSWVPRWHQRVNSLIIAPFSLEDRYYDACRISETKVNYMAEAIYDPKLSAMTLKVRAIILGSIASSGVAQEAMQMTKATEVNVANVVEETWNTIAEVTITPTMPHSDARFAFLATLTGGLLDDTRPAHEHRTVHTNDFIAYCQQYCNPEFVHKLYSPADIEAKAAQNDEAPVARNYALALTRYWHKRKFFTMNTGHFGLGPGLLEPGDMVAVLFGARVPFVLRPTGTERLCRLVGECYVHDFMEGEAVEALGQKIVKSEVISLT